MTVISLQMLTSQKWQGMRPTKHDLDRFYVNSVLQDQTALVYVVMLACYIRA